LYKNKLHKHGVDLGWNIGKHHFIKTPVCQSSEHRLSVHDLPNPTEHRPMVSGGTIIERLAYAAVIPVRERWIFFQSIPQYVEAPPNIEAKRIISYFSAVLS
jgi:hypothetical protein